MRRPIDMRASPAGVRVEDRLKALLVREYGTCRHARYCLKRVLAGVSATNLQAGPTLATAPMISRIAAALR